MNGDELVRRDARVVWHPYTQHATEPAPLAVAAASGARLVLADGRVLIDAISSWWTSLHGHGEPRLVAAMERQARTLDHVLFAGATHEPAVALAEELARIAPIPSPRVFFSDNGSTAVEVALKIALQSAWQGGRASARTFVALEGGYHGDTFGAMAVGDPDPWFRRFGAHLFDVRRVPVDPAGVGRALTELGERCAGLVVEPLVQGAGGMRMHDVATLRAFRELSTKHGVPLIADEVMTGFGRTGALFACAAAGIEPDLLCVAKGLTGGLMPLAATVCSDASFRAFWHEDRSRALFHGHSFTAHPIACAVAVESLALVRERDVPARLDAIGAALLERLAPLADHPRAMGLRRTGGIVAYDLVLEGGERGYLARVAPLLRARAAERGVLLRPLGNVVYAMPPACTGESELDAIADAMVALADAI